jgi:hypothetical protein
MTEARKLEILLAELRHRLLRDTNPATQAELKARIQAVQEAMSMLDALIAAVPAQSLEKFDPAAATRQIERFRELGGHLTQGLKAVRNLGVLMEVVSNVRHLADSLLQALGGGARRWPP